MNTTAKDMRGFVDGIVEYLEKDDNTRTVAPKVEKLLGKISTSAQKGHHAVVETAVKMDPKEIETVTHALSRAVGFDVDVENTVNPALIGGMRITFGDWVLDTSFRHQLQAVSEYLLE